MTISSPEEIAYHLGWIGDEQLRASAEKYEKSSYGEQSMAVLGGKIVL